MCFLNVAQKPLPSIHSVASSCQLHMRPRSHAHAVCCHMCHPPEGSAHQPDGVCTKIKTEIKVPILSELYEGH